jgi:hypothetical protein
VNKEQESILIQRKPIIQPKIETIHESQFETTQEDLQFENDNINLKNECETENIDESAVFEKSDQLDEMKTFSNNIILEKLNKEIEDSISNNNYISSVSIKLSSRSDQNIGVNENKSSIHGENKEEINKEEEKINETSQNSDEKEAFIYSKLSRTDSGLSNLSSKSTETLKEKNKNGNSLLGNI